MTSHYKKWAVWKSSTTSLWWSLKIHAVVTSNSSIAGPEIDDDDDKNNVDFNKPTHGIDDSFFEGSDNDIDGPKPRVPYPNGSRRGSLPPFPKVPPGYGGSDVVSKGNFN